MNSHSKQFTGYLVLVLTTAIGSVSLLLFAGFLFGVTFTTIDMGYGTAGALAWDAALCLLFFVQHSVMVRKGFRRRLAALVPDHYQGALYTVASSVVLIVLVLFWQASAPALVSIEGASRWLVDGVFFASVAGMVWGTRALHSVDVFGTRQIQARMNAGQEPVKDLVIRGPYRWVRHPLYFFSLVLIWSRPDVTSDRLLFNILFTAWIIVGTVLEERDLVAGFGDAYRDYRRKVPMLIPWRLTKPFPAGE